MQTQTEPFIDRPPTPLFMPKKSGMDVTTQIEPGDLFDFDFEVEPILEVLVGKVLEQGLMEVMEEEELKAMRAHQEHFEQIRNAELIATQRMEEAEKRKLAEKERRLAQETDRVKNERVLREKVAACAFARGYLNGLVNTVFQDLVASGHFYDPVEREVKSEFLPWLSEEAAAHVAREQETRATVQALVLAAVERLAASKAAEEARREEEERQRAEEAARLAREAAELEARTEAFLSDKATVLLAAPEEEGAVRLVSEEQAAAAKAELEAKAAKAAERQYKRERRAKEKEVRDNFPPLEASEPAAEGDAPATDADADAAEGEGAAPGQPDEAAIAAHNEKLQAEIAAALEALPKPEPVPVTEADIVLRVFRDPPGVEKEKQGEWRQGLLAALEAKFPEEYALVKNPPPPAPVEESEGAEAAEPAAE